MIKSKDEEVAEQMANGSSKLLEQASKVQELLKKSGGAINVEEISDLLECSKRHVFKVIGYLERIGYDLKVDGERVSLLRDQPVKREDPIQKPIYRNETTFGVVCSALMGHSTQQIRLLHTAYSIAEKRGVDFMVHMGGLVPGRLTRKRQEEIILQRTDDEEDFDLQRDWAAKHYPKIGARNGGTAKTYLLGGLEEQSFKSAEGYNILRAICVARKDADLVYLGDFVNWITIGEDVEVAFIYPRRGAARGAYTQSYKPQRLTTAMVKSLIPRIKRPDSRKLPELLLVGRWGSYGEDYYGKTQVVSAPRISAPELWEESPPDTGMLIVTVRFKDDDTFDRIDVEFINLASYIDENDHLEEPGTIHCEVNCGRELLQALVKKPMRLGEMSRKLDSPNKKIKEIIEGLKECGYRIVLDGETKRYFWDRGLRKVYRPIPLDEILSKNPKHIRAGVPSDTHYRGKHECPEAVEEAYNIMERERVDAAVHSGDVFAGSLGAARHYGFGFELKETESDAQVEGVAKDYPRKDFRTYMREGQHDTWAYKAIGHRPVKYLCEKRDDLTFLDGEDPVCRELYSKHGVKIISLHPEKGKARAKSYALQVTIENAIEAFMQEGIHVVVCGNWHDYYAMFYMGMVTMMVPCFEKQTSFERGKGLFPKIGVCIIDVTLDKYGNVFSFLPRVFWISPDEVEKKNKKNSSKRAKK